MDWLIHSIHHHQVMWTLGAYYFTASAVGALPTPTQLGGFYRWFFDFSHVFSANIFRVVATRLPLSQQFQQDQSVQKGEPDAKPIQ